VALFVTVLALVVRIAWIGLVPTRPVGDFAMYIESARYLVEHGSLDPEFIYMPGYVAMVAAVDALGGGLYAIKLIGVASGAITTAAVYGTTEAVFGRRAAIAAGLACALWPAGIAVSSVTGTDMPAAALLAAAVWVLVRQAGAHPRRAAALYGLVLGLAAYVRAVALPLVVLSALYFRGVGARWGQAVARTLLAAAVAFVVLIPWGLRNRHLYGELSFTDAHGGHTALVGANPNSDGRYSRSLNRLFAEGTPYALFAPPHRESDRAAYELAKSWTRLEPAYAVGLLAAKADRLLTIERSLLYWPLYRVSVLPEGSAVLRFFSEHRTGVERVVDGFWFALVVTTLIGIVVALTRRNWMALSLLPLPLALIALYTLFFAEARYHLAIVALLLPFAGAGMTWLIALPRYRRSDRSSPARLHVEAAFSALAVAVVFLGWPRLLAAGERLRDRHRFAVCVCSVEGAKHVCAFRPTDPPPGEAPSPVRGVWDGFGLRALAPRTAAATTLELSPGKYRVAIRAESAGPAPGANAAVELSAASRAQASVRLARVPWPDAGTLVTLGGVIEHAGGPLHVEVAVCQDFLPVSDGHAALWTSMITVEREAR
jgi:4-amino-4-deoxy-L-arabinose transferase-like glycosyltransferase